MKQYICCGYDEQVCSVSCVHREPHSKREDCFTEFVGNLICPISEQLPYCIPVNEEWLNKLKGSNNEQ